MLTVVNRTGRPLERTDWIAFGVLALCSALHLEAVRGVERAREGARTGTPYVDLKSIWTFAGVLLLPPALAVGLVVFTFLYLRWRVVRMVAHRWAFNGATVVIATHAAGVVLLAGLPAGVYPGLPSSFAGVFVIVLAAALRWFVNHGLVVTIILLASPDSSPRSALGSFSTNIVEAAAVSLGAATALAIAHDPWYVLFVLPPLLVLHRSLLLHQYESAARTDHKTGLANALHWTQVARVELAKAERDGERVGILMLDLDHFKQINDVHGHLAGDAVLKAVADTLRRESRDHDLVGRFGGEEFVCLLPGTSGAELGEVAERLRMGISEVATSAPTDHGPVTVSGLTTSIGAVAYPADGSDLDELLLAADTALYRAKNTGRDRVCFAFGPEDDGKFPRARQPEDH